MRFYRVFSLTMFVVFVVVGVLFLVVPAGVLGFFNSLSANLGIGPGSGEVGRFYLGLAVAYMALVSALALLMYRRPENQYFPLLLAVGKLSSSALSLLFFLVAERSLILVTNFVVDGAIGVAAALFAVRITRTNR
jgi:hypothetical protein